MDTIDVDGTVAPEAGFGDLLRKQWMYVAGVMIIVIIISAVWLYLTFKPTIKTRELNDQNTILTEEAKRIKHLESENSKLRSNIQNLYDDATALKNELVKRMENEPPPKAKTKAADLKAALTEPEQPPSVDSIPTD